MNLEILRFIRYISWKLDCLREQEENPLTVDVEKAQKHYDELQQVIQEKVEALKGVMPKVPVLKERKCPAQFYNKDGAYSKRALDWLDFLKERKLPLDTTGIVKYTSGYTEPNPQSTTQIKDWLFSMGWKPCTYKYDRNKETGEEKKIPQVRYSAVSDPRKGQLTESVLRLKSKCPEVEILEGLTVAQHRSSIFEGFLEYQKDGKVVSSAGGFTNTLRLKHRAPIVNLPGVKAAWGKEIRGCIVAPDGYQLVGSDVSSLEDMTKRHYLWQYDPDYVQSMATPGFDPHMKLLVVAEKIKEGDYEHYVTCKLNGKEDEVFKQLDSMRAPAKTTNYSATYKVGAPKLSREGGMSLKEARAFLDAFWKLNWSILKLEKDQYIKTLSDGSMWLKNPVSGFYYNLRYDKDCFSTLNQGTGVYIFDLWVMFMRKAGLKIPMQYHDEVLFATDNVDRDKKIAKEAMEKVNKTLALNVDIQIEAKSGNNYAEVH